MKRGVKNKEDTIPKSKIPKKYKKVKKAKTSKPKVTTVTIGSNPYKIHNFTHVHLQIIDDLVEGRLKKGEIAKKNDITSQMLCNYFKDPQFMKMLQSAQMEAESVFRTERIRFYRRIAQAALIEITHKLESAKERKKLTVPTLLNMVDRTLDMLDKDNGISSSGDKNKNTTPGSVNVNIMNTSLEDQGFRNQFKMILKGDSQKKLPEPKAINVDFRTEEDVEDE